MFRVRGDFVTYATKTKQILSYGATALIPDDHHPYYGVACIYAFQGKKELALDFWEKTLEKGFRD